MGVEVDAMEVDKDIDNIFVQVLRYLFSNSTYENKDAITFQLLSTISIPDMIQTGVLHKRASGFNLDHLIIENRDKYPLYQFTKIENLANVAEDLLHFNQSETPYFDLLADVALCCTETTDNNCTFWNVLNEPEYLIPQLQCDQQSPTVAA